MTWGWQDLVAFCLVLTSIAYLARNARRLWAGRPIGGCGTHGCGGCPRGRVVRSRVRDQEIAHHEQWPIG